MKKNIFVPSLLAIAIMPSVSFADFLADSKTEVEATNYYMNTDYRNSDAAQSKSEEWAQGFNAKFESGFTEGTVGVGVDVMAGAAFKLDSGDGTAGTGLLPEDRSSGGSQDNFTKLGVTGKAKISNTVLRVGALTPEMPVLMYDDEFLLPQVFRGVDITSNEIDNLTLKAGQITQVNDANSSDYTDMTVSIGESRNVVNAARNGDQFRYLGGDYNINPNLLTSYYYAELENYYKQHFLGASYIHHIDNNQSLVADIRYSRSTNDGTKYVNNIDNKAFGAMLTYLNSGHAVGLGYQKMGGDTGFAYLEGKKPYLVNDVLIGSFSSADETSWQVRYDYDFANMGVDGLSFMTRYVKGENIDRGAGLSEGHEWERNTDVAYVMQDGPAKDLSLTLRNSTYRSNLSSGNIDEVRLIVSYPLSI